MYRCVVFVALATLALVYTSPRSRRTRRLVSLAGKNPRHDPGADCRRSRDSCSRWSDIGTVNRDGPAWRIHAALTLAYTLKVAADGFVEQSQRLERGSAGSASREIVLKVAGV
jgi:hypothetical protein